MCPLRHLVERIRRRIINILKIMQLAPVLSCVGAGHFGELNFISIDVDKLETYSSAKEEIRKSQWIGLAHVERREPAGMHVW